MGDLAAWAGVFIAIASLIVSIIAMLKSMHAQHEANAVQRRIVHIEERREEERQLGSHQARLRLELRNMGSGSYRLYLINDGMAEARNVRVILDDLPLDAHQTGVRGEILPSLVGPNAEVSCFLRITLGCQPPFQAAVHWDDNSGIDRSYRTTLTL